MGVNTITEKDYQLSNGQWVTICRNHDISEDQYYIDTGCGESMNTIWYASFKDAVLSEERLLNNKNPKSKNVIRAKHGVRIHIQSSEIRNNRVIANVGVTGDDKITHYVQIDRYSLTQRSKQKNNHALEIVRENLQRITYKAETL